MDGPNFAPTDFEELSMENLGRLLYMFALKGNSMGSSHFEELSMGNSMGNCYLEGNFHGKFTLWQSVIMA